jgi:cation diffusion facilitator family transporter
MSNENENENNYDYLSIPMDVKEKLLNNINSKKQNDINDNNNNSFNQEEEDSLSSEQENHHHHDHNIDQNDAMKKLFYVSFVCLIFMCIEIIGGYLANSIAIMSDAAHLLSDLFGFVISIISITISKKVATNTMSFGFHRAEIIGALVSVTLIWGLTLWLLYEATVRMINPVQVDSIIMIIIAVIGFLFNVVMGIVLSWNGIGHVHIMHNHKHDEEHEHEHDDDDEHDHKKNKNVNLRAALIHVIGDALQNIGILIAGIIIYFFPSYNIMDPLCTYIFSIIVGFTTISILKDCISVLMEGVPMETDLNSIEKDLKNINGVIDIHDLHVWCLSIGKISMSCHLSCKNPQKTLVVAHKLLKKKYKISHTTIQVEDVKRDINCRHSLH